MANENVKSMIDSLVDGDNVAAQDSFKNALSDKIGQALDDKRQSVATDWLNAGDEMQATKDAAVLTADTAPAEVETPAPVEVDQGEEQTDDVSAVQD
jgi:hypothetical protein|tara:strand:+ start:678 stop:968 length:291 start_codon:yes stop_codon:yes gene_type:complete